MNWGITKRKNNQELGFGNFKHELDSFFNSFLDFTPSNFFDNDWNPAIDIEENNNSIIIKAEVPGIEEKNLNITLEGNTLVISGTKEEDSTKEEHNYFTSERKFGSFKRTIVLPENIDTKKIKADYKNGVLELSIKKTKVEEPKKIEIKVN